MPQTNPFGVPDLSADRAVGRRALMEGIALLALLIALFHGPSLAGDFVYDDHWTIVENAFIRDPHNIAVLLTRGPARADVPDAGRPALLVTEMIDHALWGLRPAGYHLQNLVWHLGVASLLFAGLAALTGSGLLAFTAAGLFAVHPLGVEAVAAINYREDLLAAFFLLAALLLLGVARRSASGVGRAGFRTLSFVFVMLSGFSKENGAVAPVLLVVLDHLLLARTSARRCRLDQLAFALSASVPLLWRAWALGSLGVVSRTAEVPARHGDRLYALPRAALGFADGLGQVIVPLRFSPNYSEPGSGPLVTILGAIVVAALVSMVVWMIRAGRRRHVSPLLAAGFLFGVVAYLPTAGLVPITNLRADRYFYLPALGLCTALASMLLAALGRSRRLREGAFFGVPRPWLAAGLILVLLGARTARQGRIWRNDLALWTHAAAVDPADSRAWRNLAEARLRRGLLAGARAAVDRSLALGEDLHARELSGLIRLEAGDPAGAHSDLERALAAARGRPRAELLNSLGLSDLALGQREQALARFAQARQLAPDYDRPWLNAASALAAGGRRAEAIRLLRELLLIQPASSEARRQLHTLGADATDP